MQMSVWDSLLAHTYSPACSMEQFSRKPNNYISGCSSFIYVKKFLFLLDDHMHFFPHFYSVKKVKISPKPSKMLAFFILGFILFYFFLYVCMWVHVCVCVNLGVLCMCRCL